jgi:S1-C subfamily serine protease
MAGDTGSIVQVMAVACGMVTSGSGFFVGPNLVITNAHVVAGDPAPTVTVGTSTVGTEPVLFDPNLDIAVLHVATTSRPALTLVAGTAAPSTTAMVLGYPYGGPIRADMGTVISHDSARTSDIYGSGTTSRDIYEVRGLVRPGDSGSPVLGEDGRVLGVIFAAAPDDPTLAYAITSNAILQRMQLVATAGRPVDDGHCVRTDTPFVMEISGVP